MAYFAMIYDLVDDYMARRGAFREEHLKMAADAHTRGELMLGGAFADPPDKALMIFRADDSKVAESFARTDPYVLNGLVKHWEIRPWNVVIENK
ncbi:MAG TPA: YciI-like protein [Candidatus Acidoferrales bacterium]